MDSFENTAPAMPGKSKKFLADKARARRMNSSNSKHDFGNTTGPDTGQGNHEFTLHFSFPAVAAMRRARQNANSYPKGNKAGGTNLSMNTGKNWPR